jgi:DNA-binding response OmpR family regulator
MSKGKILYIEDYPVIQQLYHQVLGGHGFSVYVAGDGKKALEMVGKDTYDLILLDLLLPQLSGIEFLQELRKQDKKTPVIILTDFDKPETMEAAKQLGVTDYWMKVDHTPHVLADRVEQFLKKSSSA